MKTETAFWDASGLVLLCINQTDSSRSRKLARRFKRKIAWWGTSIEIESAFSRLLGEGKMSKEDLRKARAVWQKLERTLLIIQPDEVLREIAKSLPEKYGLRALDSLQLAAALRYCKEKSRDYVFICFDEKLAEAAEKDGFTIFP